MSTQEVKECRTKEELGRVLDLRYRILRAPWGQSAESATDGLERSCVNAYIEDQQGVVACGRLQRNPGNIGQIRYMAVDERGRGLGFGRLVLAFLEQRAASMGMEKIELQARENAVGFYERHGYVVKEKTFLLWGQIQHFLMEKSMSV